MSSFALLETGEYIEMPVKGTAVDTLGDFHIVMVHENQAVRLDHYETIDGHATPVYEYLSDLTVTD